MGKHEELLQDLEHGYWCHDDNDQMLDYVKLEDGKKAASVIRGLEEENASLNTRLDEGCAQAIALEAENKELRKDKARLDWLEKSTHEGFCPGLLFDDDGHWAVSMDGSQSISHMLGEGPGDVSTSFFVTADEWHESVRDAIDHSIATDGEAGGES